MPRPRVPVDQGSCRMLDVGEEGRRRGGEGGEVVVEEVVVEEGETSVDT